MTEENKAVKTLAEELAKTINTVKKRQVPVNAANVVGLPSAMYGILSSLEYKSESGDEVAAQILNYFHNMTALEVEHIAADTAEISKLYATYGEFMELVADKATIGDLDVDQIRSNIIATGLITADSAEIYRAQIQHAGIEHAFVRASVEGKVFIDDLAVTNANIVSLAAGEILLNDGNGNMVKLTVNGEGEIVTSSVAYDGDDIVRLNSLSGGRIVEGSITADRLNATEIFSQNADIKTIISENIDASLITTGTLRASVIGAGTIDSDKISAQGITASKIIGGTLTLGGNNNTNGQILVKDANGAEIGKWTKDGISVKSGSITGGSINGASLTLGGNNNTSGTLVVKDASNATVGTWDSSGISISKGSITGGTINGAALTLGGSGNSSGTLTINNASGAQIGKWDSYGIDISKGVINMGSTSSIKISLDQSNDMYAQFDTDGFLLLLDNSSRIQTQAVYYTQDPYSIFPINIRLGSLCSEYRDNNTEWRSIMSSTDAEFSKIVWNGDEGSHIYEAKIGIDGIFYKAVSEGTYFSVDPHNNRVMVHGDFDVLYGVKSRVVVTDQYSNRSLYCYETPSPMFGDVGEGIIGNDGLCYISIDPIFAQTISTIQYQVFLQKYNEGDVWIKERVGSYFIVQGTPGLAFGWEIKAKQHDFDQLRLERYDDLFVVPRQNYGEEAADYIQELEKGRIE